MNAIRHIAVATRADIVALGEFENAVSVFQLYPWQPQASFPTVLDFGGRRLELSPDGSRCFAGAYHVNGVACYSADSGALLWRRPDLKKVQELRHSIDADGVYCFFDQGPAHLLCSLTGETLAKHAGLRSIDQSSVAPVDLLGKRSLELRMRKGELIRKIERTTFALLAACFAPTRLLISESGGGLRCFDSNSGSELWRSDPPNGEHFLSLSYSRVTNRFYGVAWPYEQGGEKRLFLIEQDVPLATPLLTLGRPAVTVFTNAGESLVTSDGALVNLGSLQVRLLWPSPNNSPKPTVLLGTAQLRC